MSSIIVEKYAHLLAMKDIVDLFQRLEETVGNKTEAARMCGLERKTTYGWKLTREIRLKTKKKILAALIENLTEETLDFIVQRSAEASADVLRIYLSALYEKTMDENMTVPEFIRLTSKFNQIKQKYAGLVVDRLQVEVGNMSRHIVERADELGISFRPSPIDIVKLTEFSMLIPNLIRTISAVGPYTPDDEIGSIFNIPKEFVDNLSTALHDNYIAIRATAPPQRVQALYLREQIVPTGTFQPREEGAWTEHTVPEIELPILGGTT